MRALVWFRADLRVRDNTALYHACRAADDGVVAVFAICPGQWRAHDWGPMKVDFLLRNLHALSQSLAKLNVPLLVVTADTFDELPDKLLKLATKHKCDALYLNREYEVNEARRDEAVSAVFEKSGRSVHAFADQTILGPAAVRTNDGGWYSVFTPFKKRWIETFDSGDGLSVLPVPKRQRDAPAKPDSVPSRVKSFAGRTRPDLWPAGETHAASRLRSFVKDRLPDYNKQRDFPGIDGTSGLSPYLASGVISPRQCLQAALDANNGRLAAGKKGVTTWIGELIWREFYRHVLVGFPRVCMNRPFRPETDGLPWRYDEKHFEAWCEARTGVPIVDAGMRQLAETGWMHNRVRMIVAMYLTKGLFIDWRLGERHFMQHLVDGDFASNNGGWQWSASTGTDAAPYFRIFNPFSQSRRYDPRGEYIRRFVPELASLADDAVHEPHRSRGSQAKRVDYPAPIVDHAAARQHVLDAFKQLRS